jgi:hypothetical protein
MGVDTDRGLAEWDMNSSEVEATLRGREMIVALDQCATPIAARRLAPREIISNASYRQEPTNQSRVEVARLKQLRTLAEAQNDAIRPSQVRYL